MADPNKYRMVSPYEAKIVEQTLREFSERQTWRNTHAIEWEEIAQLIDPPSRNTFFYGNYNYPGQKKTDRQIDATGMMALHRFQAICDSLLTPRNAFWHGLEADVDYLLKNREVALWFAKVVKILFKLRYSDIGNFSSQNQGVFRSLGAFGTGAMFVDAAYTLDGRRGLRYKNVPLGELFFSENYQGLPDSFIRWFMLTARQAKQRWPDNFPDALRTPLEQNSQMLFNFLHRVAPRDDYDPQRRDAKGKIYGSHYISIEGECLLQEGGYNSFPMAISRYEQAPMEVYGRGPASYVLPALKTLNAEKTSYLKQAHRAGDPVLLTTDDGVTDFSFRPGAMNKGGVTSDGKPLIHVLPTGNFEVAKEAIQEERQLINDAFLVSLFQILTETPTMTATEVIERTNEKGILMAPTMGRQQAEYLGPLVARELDVAAQLRLLPPMPPALREAGGGYSIVHTSPMSRAMRAGEVSGFMRAMENTKELVQITGDVSLLDPYDFDVIEPEIADVQAVPANWMATPQKIAEKRKNRAAAQQRQEQIQAAPAQAAIIKAQAAMAKSGGQQQPQQGGGMVGPPSGQPMNVNPQQGGP